MASTSWLLPGQERMYAIIIYLLICILLPRYALLQHRTPGSVLFLYLPVLQLLWLDSRTCCIVTRLVTLKTPQYFLNFLVIQCICFCRLYDSMDWLLFCVMANGSPKVVISNHSARLRGPVPWKDSTSVGPLFVLCRACKWIPLIIQSRGERQRDLLKPPEHPCSVTYMTEMPSTTGDVK